MKKLLFLLFVIILVGIGLKKAKGFLQQDEEDITYETSSDDEDVLQDVID